MNEQSAIKSELLNKQEALYEQWLKELYTNRIFKGNSQEETRRNSTFVFNAFIKALQLSTEFDLEGKESSEIKSVLESFSKDLASKGQTPTATAMYIYSLKSVLLRFLKSHCDSATKAFYEEVMKIHDFLDTMGLFTFEYYVKEREKIIQMQQEDMLELSTPIIKVWNGIIAVPLIGTLDSKRTQIVMQKLLDAILSTSSKVAILDITGVPTVDTYVANNLINTTKAIRLLGAETIITGIS
ncbi:MAG: hypothetical protein FIA99_07565, partial [Ruminiclostridium sp.]|nr:hypothetical protein [Ruminiclostridium sp.]